MGAKTGAWDRFRAQLLVQVWVGGSEECGKRLIRVGFGPILDGMVARNRRSVVAATSTVFVLVTFILLGFSERGAAAVDANAPVLASLAITPTTVDTSAGPAVVTMTARLTDETSPSIGGAAPLSRIVLTGPGGQQQAIAYLSQAQRISGTAADGVYRSTLTIPWHAEPGRWSASAVLVDISGNTRSMSTANLAAAGFPAAVDQTGAGDTTAPQLVALGLSPAGVDTSLQSATITVSVHAVDDLSGVSDGVAKAASQVVLRGPSGAHHARATLSVDHRTAGDALDATFVVAVTLPRWSEQGVWTVEGVTLVDQVGNNQTWTAPGVSFTQTGIGDTSAPQIRSFSMATTTADVRATSASIVMQGRIVDDISGAADGLVDSPTSVVFASPSGRQRLTVPFGAAQRVSGNGLDGNYSITATVAAHAEPGVWTMADAWPTDRAGNVGHLTAADWAAKTFGGSFTVVSDTPPDTGPTVPPTPTTTTTSFDPSTTTTTSFDPSTTTTTDAGATTTTLDPSSTTTTSFDPLGSTTSTDAGATTTTLGASTSTTTLDPSTTTTAPDPTTTVPGESTTTTSAGDTTSTSAPDETTTTVTTPASTSTSTSTSESTSTSTSTVAVGTTTSTVTPATTTTTTTTTVPIHTDSNGPPHVRRANGYWFATTTGQVVGFGAAARSSVATGSVGWTDRVVGIATTPSGNGYWLATAQGDIRSYGDARSFGSMFGRPLAKPIVGIAATPNGNGYWLVATDGGIFSFGNARFYGSTGAIHLNQPIVGMTSTPSGRGYWFVAADGGLFSYGDARFLGSMGASRLNQPVVGMAAAPSGRGYWLAARDGGVFSFGSAPFFGSTGSIRLNRPIVGMAASPTARGYWFVAADGGIFSFGDARFFGSFANSSSSVTGMAVRAS